MTIPPKFLLFYAGAVTLTLLFFVLSSWTKPVDDEISVKRINVLNEDGTSFFVIANPERTPSPRLNGVEYKRAVKGGGAIIYNQKGDERGGIAVLDDEQRAMNAFILDYKTTDAIGMFTRESADLKDYVAMLSVNDPDQERKIGHGIQRISVGTANGNAGITINGTNGEPRLVIQVDSTNQLIFHVLDENGAIAKKFVD